MDKLSCDICGGSLIFIDDLDNLTCDICGVKYSKEAIKIKLANSKNNTEKSSAVIDSEKEKLIERAEGFVKIKQYSKAVSSYWDLMDAYPDDINIICKYLDISTNYYVSNMNHLLSALNSLKNLANTDISHYVDKFFNNIINNKVDVFYMFWKFQEYKHSYKDFKDSMVNELLKLFTVNQVNEIISVGESNVKLAKFMKFDDSLKYYGCYFLISNFVLLYSKDCEGCIYLRPKAVNYDDTDVTRINSYLMKEELVKQRVKDKVCVYCGGQLKGFINKCCCNCGKESLSADQARIYINRIIDEII